MYYDSPDAKHFSDPIMSEKEFELKLEAINDCILLMNIINSKKYKTEEDEQQWMVLKVKAECLIQAVTIYVEEHMELVWGQATELFRRAKERAGSGEPQEIKTWQLLEPLKEEMMHLQIKQRGTN